MGHVSDDSIWPPPPVREVPTPAYPFETQFYTTGESVPDVRGGVLRLGADGVNLDGRAIARAEIQFPLYVLGALAFFVGILAVALVMEFIVRLRVQAHIPWARVRRIVTVPRRQQVCLVYDAPNSAGAERTWALTIQLERALYLSFVAEAERYAPGCVAPGKLRAWTPAYAWVFIVPILALGLIALASLVVTLLHAGAGA